MKAIRFSILATLVVLMASCQEEIWPNGIVKEGIATSVDFSISVPAAEEISVTKASVAASESEIRELMLIMFEKSNGRKMVLDLTPYMDAGTVSEGYRKYTLTRPIDQDMYGGQVLSGTYKVYAVANWSSSFSALSELDQMSESELLGQIAMNQQFVYNISGSERFPMSSITDNVAIELDGKSSLQIKLKRLVARIEFEFQNGSSQVDGKDENPNFIPSSYAIYNIPSKANLFSKDNNAMSGLADGDFGKSADISLSSRSFEFFMLENVQNVKTTGCDSQAKRETWSGGTMGASTLPEDKNFTYAPDYGTFVVVKGSYTGTSYIGDVSYTIHLGNFSEKTNTANGKDFSNFKVNRNERQIYKVTVNGVRSIVTEVTANNETQPGAEGAFAETAENVFVLDAHYEKVMMDLTGLGESAYLFVDTPYCPDNNGHAQVKLAEKTKADLDEMGLDYKWVSFIKPAAADNFPDYVKANSGDIHDLVNDIIAGTGKYYAEIDGKKLTAAFVDEYFYETKPDGSAAKWTEFANTDNRTMSIRPGISYSTDGNSSLVQNSHIELSQRSIKTTYAFDGKDPNDGVYVPFGIETWDETWSNGGYFYTNNNNTYSPSGLTDDNGWNNTKILTSGAIPANVSKAGYLSSISDNSKESHVYTSYTGGLGYNACLLRNRDENNDGQISDSELKWYLPAIQQYTNIWLSEDMLHEDTQLFDRAQLSAVGDALNRSSVYYSSSPALKRLYWALEGASYGEYNSNWSNANNRVRCVRNLVANSSGAEGAVYNGVPSILATDNHSANVISVDNITAVRNIDHIGEYGIRHSERSSDNLLPSAFEVAKVYLGETIGAGTGNLITIPEKTWLVLNADQCTGSRSGILSYTYSLTLSINPIEGDSYTCNGTVLDSSNNYTATFSGLSSATLNVRVTKADGSSKTIPVTFEFNWRGQYNDTDYVGVDPEQEIYDGEIKTGNGTGSKDRFDESSFNATDLCSQGYYQQPDRSDLGMWRVPNQRELMLMLQFGYVVAANREGCFSSTFLTGHSSSFKNQPFGTYNSGITLNTTQNSYMYVRCVMDAQAIDDGEEEGGETPPVTPPVSGGDEGGEA